MAVGCIGQCAVRLGVSQPRPMLPITGSPYKSAVSQGDLWQPKSDIDPHPLVWTFIITTEIWSYSSDVEREACLGLFRFVASKMPTEPSRLLWEKITPLLYNNARCSVFLRIEMPSKHIKSQNRVTHTVLELKTYSVLVKKTTVLNHRTNWFMGSWMLHNTLWWGRLHSCIWTLLCAYDAWDEHL